MQMKWLPCIALLATMPSLTWAHRDPAASPATKPPTPMQCFGDDFRARVEQGIAGYADVVDIPGISFGIVRGDGLIQSGGIGFADRSAQRIATVDTAYNIASITKVFTATLAMMLVDEGRLDLDAPAAGYLPASVRMPRDKQGAAITIRSLLTHTSGLPRDPPNRRRAINAVDVRTDHAVQFRADAHRRDVPKDVALSDRHTTRARLTEAPCRSQHCVEHRLHVGR